MPPRASSDIRLETPTNGASPPSAADLDLHLPLRFEGAYLQYRTLLPFLPWADEVVAAGAEPSYSNISAFSIESILLECVSFQAAAQARNPVDTTFKASFIKRVLKYFLTQNLSDEPVQTEEAYVELLQKHVQGLDLTARAFLIVTESALLKFESRDAAYTADLAFMEALSWGSFKDRSTSEYAKAKRFLRLLGDRTTKAARQDSAGRLCVVAAQIGAAFNKVYSDFTFPPTLITQQIVSWFINLKWPTSLDIQLDTVDCAFTEFLRMYRYETGTVAQQSALVSEVFSRVLSICPALQSVAGDAPSRAVHDALRPMLAAYDIPSAPLVEDWKTLNSQVEHLRHLAEDIGCSANLLTARIKILLDDKQLEKRAVASKFTGSSEQTAKGAITDGQSQYHARVSASSLNELRRSPELLELVKSLNEELGQPAPSQSRILSLCLSSRLSGVVCYMTGVLDTLEVSDVFAQISHLRARKLNQESLARLCKHMWLTVFEGELEEFPRVADATFHPAFLRDLFMSKWSSIDFEQRLVFDLDLAKSGSTFNGNFNRPKAQWFQEEHGVTDLMAPVTILFEELGYEGAQQENSFASLLGEARQGFLHARRNPDTAPSVIRHTKELIPKAVVEAQEAYSNFFGSSSALALFPESWLPLDSTATSRLNSAKRSAKVYNDLMADLKEVMDDSVLRRDNKGASKAPPSSSSSSEKLKKEVKQLQDQIKAFKAKGNYPPITHS